MSSYYSFYFTIVVSECILFILSQLVIRGFAEQALRNYTQFAVEEHCEQLLRADRYIALFFDGENSLFQISDYSGSINNTSNSSNDNNLIRHNHITKISKADMMNSYVSIKFLHKAFLDTNNNEYAMKKCLLHSPPMTTTLCLYFVLVSTG